MRKGLTVLIVAVLGVFAVKSVIGPGKMSLGGGEIRCRPTICMWRSPSI